MFSPLVNDKKNPPSVLGALLWNSFSCRISNDGLSILDIMHNHRSSPDNSVFPDLYARQNDCSRANESLLSNSDAAAKNRSRRDMNMIGDYTVMIDRRSCIHDNVPADLARRLDDSTVQNLDSFTQITSRRNLSRRRKDAKKNERALMELFVKSAPWSEVDAASDAIY